MTDRDEKFSETVYEHLLKIEKLTYAAELLADACPNLQLEGAPPIEYLLSMANDELRSLQASVSEYPHLS
jgi:hypothetical protein